jgi:cbb3-type cytochrome oxidase maturation protein
MVDTALPIFSLLLGLIFIIGLIWAIKTGMFTDIEKPKHRMMKKDDDNTLED